MMFQCKDCSYRGTRSEAGACPACGSFNLASAGKRPGGPTTVRKPYRLALLAAVWLLWLVLLYRQFFS